MEIGYKLKSGQINYESTERSSSFACIVIRDGKFNNLSEDLRLDLIQKLQEAAPKKEIIDIEDMF